MSRLTPDISRLVCLISAISLISIISGFSNALALEPAWVELIAPKNSAPWIGQRVTFAVNVAVEGQFDGSTWFDLPQVPGAILMKPDERPVLSTRTIEETQYSVQRHEFALFCQRSGAIMIPEFHVRCGSVKVFGQRSQEHNLSVPSFTLTPHVPQGANPGQIVITTTRLEVSEQWSASPDLAKVGDAFTRKVTVRAAQLPGMLLPPLPRPPLEGLAVYPRPPETQDKIERGEFTGERVETVAYICERAGTVEIPSIRYRWWNPDKLVWEEHTLSAATLQISPKLAFAPAETPPPSWRWLWLIVAALLVAFAWFFVARRRKQDVEAELFRDVLRACRDNDATRTYNAWIRWHAAVAALESMPPVTIQAELQRMQRKIIGREDAWQGKTLAGLLNSWRRDLRRIRRMKAAVSAPPGLNPVNLNGMM